MENKKQPLPDKISELTTPYVFQLQADVGVTKHMGGLKATKELIELCHINKDKYVLDIGCGVGKTPCYIAKNCGCRVVGVDISARMIAQSNERAKREGVADRVEFRVADAQSLPFEDVLFDVVIGESVIAFAEDKRRAVSEYVRVTKPGGYVGLNESIWLKEPSPEMVEYISRTTGAKTEVLTSHTCEELLEGSGLRDLVVRTYKVTYLGEIINGIRRYGLRDSLMAWFRTLLLYFIRPAYRSFTKEAKSQPKALIQYLGYGIYVGRK